MENPWRKLDIPSTTYVLPEDHTALEEANRKRQAGPQNNNTWRYLYRPELIPDPYVGRLDAPVVIFTLNPGYTPRTEGDDNCNDDWWHMHSTALHEAYRRNLREESSQYPMFFLDPAFANNPGGRYWTRKLGDLIDASGGADVVARNVVTIEFFPYHSNKFGGGCKVPSQKFAFYQIQRAMDRKAVIIIVRAKRRLLAAIPELSDYPRVITVNSPTSGYVSRGNVPDFEQIVGAIRKQS